MAELEAQLIAKGDGVFSASLHAGPYEVRKALQGATFWEVSDWSNGGRRTFHATLAEALASVGPLAWLLAGRPVTVA